MSTPVCIANAVADALAPVAGEADLHLPLIPARIAGFISPETDAPKDLEKPAAGLEAGKSGRGLSGSGTARVGASPEAIWDQLMDPDQLAEIIPGAHGVKRVSPTRFMADVTLGVGPVKGRYRIDVALSDLEKPHSAVLTGKANGALGTGIGTGKVFLKPDGTEGTIIEYTYEASIGGKVASVGGRLLDGAAKIIIGQFFNALGRRANKGENAQGIFNRLRGIFGGDA